MESFPGHAPDGSTSVDAVWAWEDGFNNIYRNNPYDPDRNLHVPFLSVLGNHDYGGEGCLADWQGQIEFTGRNSSKPDDSWAMPFQYFKKRIQAEDFFIDIIGTDNNWQDGIQSAHDICLQHVCSDQSRKGDVANCKTMFKNLQLKEEQWFRRQVKISKREGAHWIIGFAHFTSEGSGTNLVEAMAEEAPGIAAVYLGGHTHDQKFVEPPWRKNVVQVLTGAGGGYTKSGSKYGFTTMKIDAEKIEIELVDDRGGESAHAPLKRALLTS